jgi:DNA-binding response OmpR family regulator
MTKRLLLVEDEASLSRAVARLLGRAGYEVVVADSREQALRVVGPFPVAVFDIELPDCGGVELAQELMLSGIVKRAIFFTATVDRELRDHASGIGPICNKTEGVDRLLKLIDELLKLIDETSRRTKRKAAGGLTLASTIPPPSGVRSSKPPVSKPKP